MVKTNNIIMYSWLYSMVFKFMLKNSYVIKSLFKRVYNRVELHFTNLKLILRENLLNKNNFR